MGAVHSHLHCVFSWWKLVCCGAGVAVVGGHGSGAAAVCVALTPICLPLSYSRHGHGSICYLESQWRRLRDGPQGPIIVSVGSGRGPHRPPPATLPYCHHGAGGSGAAHLSPLPAPHPAASAHLPSPPLPISTPFPNSPSPGVIVRLHSGPPWTRQWTERRHRHWGQQLSGAGLPGAHPQHRVTPAAGAPPDAAGPR